MLEGLRDRSSSAHFFAWDFEFEEAVRRHGQRTVFTPEDMALWSHGWNPVDFVDETRFDAKTTADAALERNCDGDCSGQSGHLAGPARRQGIRSPLPLLTTKIHPAIVSQGFGPDVRSTMRDRRILAVVATGRSPRTMAGALDRAVGPVG
jgi:hypothetical protein